MPEPLAVFRVMEPEPLLMGPLPEMAPPLVSETTPLFVVMPLVLPTVPTLKALVLLSVKLLALAYAMPIALAMCVSE